MTSRRTRRILLLLVLAATSACLSQPASADDVRIEDRLLAVSSRLRLALSLSSFAVYAPSVGDLHLHAQQIVNLLEGNEGPQYVPREGTDEVVRGLRADVSGLVDSLDRAPIEPETRMRIAAATRNMTSYLAMALDAALTALKQRRLEAASEEMRKVYAFLAAAYERPAGYASVPGLWTILRVYGLDTTGEET